MALPAVRHSFIRSDVVVSSGWKATHVTGGRRAAAGMLSAADVDVDPANATGRASTRAALALALESFIAEVTCRCNTLFSYADCAFTKDSEWSK